EMLVVNSRGNENVVGTSEAIAEANETLTAVAVLGREYDANNLHDFYGSQLNLAHLQLHAAGYRFVGYRWEQIAFAQDMVNNGVVRIAQPEYEQSDDNYSNRRQWRGLNVSEDIGMASDYSEPGTGNSGQSGRILRVYLPSEEVNRLYNFEPYLDTPEADSAARELIGSDISLSNVTELDQSYLMRGRAREGYGYMNDDYELVDYTETFISWALADRAIVIPAVRQIDPGTSELEVLNGASGWEEEVPRVSGRSDIVQ
ncbi:MAG: hypothetical protein ACN4GM_16920, partial [Gammaproteobacteria bacterium]